MKLRNADHDMNINRDNYEAFFLLYTDGELSAAEKEAVEAFCQLHPDLAEELQLLMDTRLQPDEGLHFGPLAGLLKPELWDADQLTPEQTQLLQQLDDDAAPTSLEADAQLRSEWQLLQATRLPADAAEAMPHKHRLIKPLAWDAAALTPAQLQLLAALEGETPLPAGLLADAELQADWQLLQATRLPAHEQLAMPHKDRLYRREAADKAPVIKLGWQRWVAAAAMLLGLGWAGLRLLPGADVQGPDAPQVAVTQPTTSASSGSSLTPSTTTSSQPAAAADPATAASTAPAALLAAQRPQPASAATTGTTVSTPAPNTTVAEPLVALSTNTPPAGTQPAEASEEERRRLIANSRLSPEEESRLRRQANTQSEQPLRLPAAERTPSPAMLAAANPADQPVQAQYAVQQEAAGADEGFINIGGAKINKQKLRGVFRVVGRKVSRTFDKSDVAAADNGPSRLR